MEVVRRQAVGACAATAESPGFSGDSFTVVERSDSERVLPALGVLVEECAKGLSKLGRLRLVIAQDACATYR